MSLIEKLTAVIEEDAESKRSERWEYMFPDPGRYESKPPATGRDILEAERHQAIAHLVHLRETSARLRDAYTKRISEYDQAIADVEAQVALIDAAIDKLGEK